jgi:prepilin-type N-terminal cleavage/methylation domain-containing protein
MRHLRPSGTARDAGVTLVETLVVIVLLSIVGTLVTRAVLDSHQIVRLTDDQTQGLADVRVASERLGRDVREARSVLCNPTGTPAALAAADPTCLYHLQLWIDYDADYAQQADETVTWRLDPSADAGHYDLVRAVGSGTGIVQSRTIVTQVAFQYDLQPGALPPAPGAPHTTTVNVDMTYDAVRNSGTSNKTVSFTARLRNVS